MCWCTAVRTEKGLLGESIDSLTRFSFAILKLALLVGPCSVFMVRKHNEKRRTLYFRCFFSSSFTEPERAPTKACWFLVSRLSRTFCVTLVLTSSWAQFLHYNKWFLKETLSQLAFLTTNTAILRLGMGSYRDSGGTWKVLFIDLEWNSPRIWKCVTHDFWYWILH